MEQLFIDGDINFKEVFTDDDGTMIPATARVSEFTKEIFKYTKYPLSVLIIIYFLPISNIFFDSLKVFYKYEDSWRNC